MLNVYYNFDFSTGALTPNALNPALSNMLVVFSAVLGILWILRIFRVGTLFVELHRSIDLGAIFRYDILLSRDLEEGVPSSTVPRLRFEEILCERRKAKHPPTKVEYSELPLAIKQSSVRVISCKDNSDSEDDSDSDFSDSDVEEDSELQIHMKVDCAIPAVLKYCWGVPVSALAQPEGVWTSAQPVRLESSLEEDSNFGQEGIAMTVFKDYGAQESPVSSASFSSDEQFETPLLHSKGAEQTSDTTQTAGISFQTPTQFVENLCTSSLAVETQVLSEGVDQEVTHSVTPAWLNETVDVKSCEERGLYPLVLLILPQPTSTVSMVQVTLVDLSVTMKRRLLVQSSVYAQFLLTPSIFMELKEIYGNEEESPECVVCLCEVKDTLILPCRHISVCRECVSKVFKCPVCRTKITAYWNFSEEKELQKDNDEKLSHEEKGSEEVDASPANQSI